MSGLKFNFNKPKQVVKPPVNTSRPAFDDEDDEENVLTKTTKKTKKQAEAIAGLNQDLRSYTALSEETSVRMAKEALEVDPSVFDYDGVYDELKAVERQKQQIAEQDRLERKPQYMDKLLASAEIRKRDYLVSQERKYKKEREEEGEEFAGKEKFVTNAYKQQQEEIRKAEEEERLKEENARKKSLGMATFYRNMMEEEERKHDSAVEAASKAAINKERKSPESMEVEITREKRLAEQAKKLNAKLGTEAVLINDEGEVVDKRQLLKGGLNILPKEKPTQQVARSDYQAAYEARRVAGRDKIKQRESQQRQQRVIEEQYAATKKRAADVEAEKEEELRLRAKSKKTSNEVIGARERYLARKQAAAQGS